MNISNEQLKIIVNAYLRALTFSDGSEPEDKYYGCDDVGFPDEFMDGLEERISMFIRENSKDVDSYFRSVMAMTDCLPHDVDQKEYVLTQFGEDLYLTQAGHVSGFWDQPYSDGFSAEKLSKNAWEQSFSVEIEMDDSNQLIWR